MTNLRLYYLEELLQPLGSVQVPRRVAGEVREIDVWFSPDQSLPVADASGLGLLGRFAATPSIFERQSPLSGNPPAALAHPFVMQRPHRNL